jgi:hypothetical protein
VTSDQYKLVVIIMDSETRMSEGEWARARSDQSHNSTYLMWNYANPIHDPNSCCSDQKHLIPMHVLERASLFS